MRLSVHLRRSHEKHPLLHCVQGAHKQKYDKLHKLEKQRNLNAKKASAPLLSLLSFGRSRHIL